MVDAKVGLLADLRADDWVVLTAAYLVYSLVEKMVVWKVDYLAEVLVAELVDK
jgi:hypothetical protein